MTFANARTVDRPPAASFMIPPVPVSLGPPGAVHPPYGARLAARFCNAICPHCLGYGVYIVFMPSALSVTSVLPPPPPFLPVRTRTADYMPIAAEGPPLPSIVS